jgi:hypothetical protein
MKEEEEDSIDKLFNRGLNNPGDDASYREEDWDRLADMLDGKKRKGIIYRLSFTIAGAAAILLLVFGWLYLNNATKPGKPKAQLVKTIPKIQKGPGTNGPPTQQLGDSKNTLSANVHEGNSADGLSRKSKSFFTLSAAAGGRTATGNDITAMSGSAATPEIDSSKQQPAIALTNNEVKVDTVKTISSVPARALVSVVDDIKPKKRKTSVAQAFKPTLALSIIGSPDINSVQGFSQNKVGTNVGMMLSLGLSKKWSVSAGAVYADKPYVAPFYKYATAYQFSTNPSSVSASCIVLDIPVNVGYRFYNKNGNKLSLGTGLSSYFMLRENYTFNYDGPYAGGPSSYNIKNQNKHLFGILNLNATYQREVNAKFDIVYNRT